MVRFPNSEEDLNRAIMTHDNIAESSPNHVLIHTGGYHIDKELTLDGNGAQIDNLFSIVGIVRLMDIYAYVTEATDSTTLTNVKFEIDDGLAQTDLTNTVNGSGAVVGAAFIKDRVAVNALNFTNPTVGTFFEPAADKKVLQELWVFQKVATTTYIRISFTGDANTDVDIVASIHYEPITHNSSITPV